MVVRSLDRLRRTVRDTLNPIHDLAQRGVGVRNLADPIKVDSCDPGDSVAQLSVLLALFAQMKRAGERAAHARSVATAKGRRVGRPVLADPDKIAWAVNLRAQGETIAQVVVRPASRAPACTARCHRARPRPSPPTSWCTPPSTRTRARRHGEVVVSAWVRQLDAGYPEPLGDPHGPAPTEANLAALWAGYAASSQHRMIYVNTVSVLQAPMILRAVGEGARAVAVLLSAGDQVAARRLAGRETTSALGDCCARRWGRSPNPWFRGAPNRPDTAAPPAQPLTWGRQRPSRWSRPTSSASATNASSCALVPPRPRSCAPPPRFCTVPAQSAPPAVGGAGPGAAHRGERPHLLCTLDGTQPSAERIDDQLRGHRVSTPVRWGNAAADQTQHDVYGEILDCAWQRAHHGGRRRAALAAAASARADGGGELADARP